jgi:hypothetical protein
MHRDIEDVQLVRLDEVQQQIERPLELDLRQRDVVRERVERRPLGLASVFGLAGRAGGRPAGGLGGRQLVP